MITHTILNYGALITTEIFLMPYQKLAQNLKKDV
jgi:hypothetical protein